MGSSGPPEIDGLKESSEKADVAGQFEVLLEDGEISEEISVLSGKMTAVESSREPRQFGEMKDFLRAFASVETAPLNVEGLRHELLASWKHRLMDYREQVYGENPMYGPNSEMEDWCVRFLDRDPTNNEFNELLVELCLGSGQAHLLLRDDSDFIVNVLLVYATRFVGRIASLSDKLRLALARYDSGFKTPYVGAHYFPRTVFLRTDISKSMDRQSELGEEAVRANRKDFSDRIAEAEYHHPSVSAMKYAGDEVSHMTDNLTSAQAFLADVQADTLGRGVLGLESAAKEGRLVMVITPGNRVMFMGPAFSVAEERQKGGKKIEQGRKSDGMLDLSDMGGVAGASFEDADGNRIQPGDDFFKTMLGGGRHNLGGGSIFAGRTQGVGVLNEGTLAGISTVESETGFGMSPIEMSAYTSLTESFSRNRIPGVNVQMSDLNDPMIVDRIVEGLGMVANSLYDLKVERLTHVKAAFLGVKFKPFRFPQSGEITSEIVKDFGDQWDRFMARVEELCEEHQVKQVYEDGDKGFFILGAGIYGSYPLNVEESLARLSRVLAEEFPDMIEYFSQTSGEVVQGPVGGDINVAGEPVGYLARLSEKLGYFREDTESKDSFHLDCELLDERSVARFVLDEPTYRSLLKRGFHVSLVARKYEGLRGLKNERRFYFASEIKFDRKSPQIPYGYDEQFKDVEVILSQVRGFHFEGTEKEAPQIRKIELLANPDVGAVEDFRAAIADQARLDGYFVLGQNTIPQRYRVYGLIQYILKELFGGNGERFSAFLSEHEVADADMLRLFFSAITGEDRSVDMRDYRELVIKGLVKVLKLYSQKEKPLCLFAHDLENMDAESQRILQALMADNSGQSGGILLISSQEGDSRAVTMSRELMAVDVFLDSEDVVTTGNIPAVPVETIELDGVDPEQGLKIVAGLLGVERGALHPDLVRFCRKVMGDDTAWSPSFIRPWIDYLMEKNFIERGNPNPLSSLEGAYSADLTMTQRMVQLRYDRLPQRSVARHMFETASFLGESAPEELLLECLKKDSKEEFNIKEFDEAKLLLAERGLMAFDGVHYHFHQGYIPAAGRRIVGYDKAERNNYREHVLNVLLLLSQRGDFVPSEILFELSHALGVPQKISPAIRNVVKAGAAYDPVNTDQLARRFLGRDFPKFKQFSAEERVAYMEIFHEWIRVLCDLNRPMERLKEVLGEAERQLELIRRPHGLSSSEVGALEVDQLDVKAHVYYWRKDNEALMDSIRSMMGVRDAELDRLYIGFHRGRLKYREADKCRRSIKGATDPAEKQRIYDEALRLASEAEGIFGNIPASMKEEHVEFNGEISKMVFMVKGFQLVELPFLAKKEGLRALSSEQRQVIEDFINELAEVLFSEGDLTPLQKVSLFYLLSEGASLLHNFENYIHLFRSELLKLREEGHVRAYVEMQLNLFLAVGEEAQYNKTQASLDLFKKEIDALFSLKPFLIDSGILVPFYTNVIEYWDMQLNLCDSFSEANVCVKNAKNILKLIHDPEECDPAKVSYFNAFVQDKERMVNVMEDKLKEKRR